MTGYELAEHVAYAAAPFYTPAERAALDDHPEHHYLTPEAMDELGQVITGHEEGRDT